MKPTSYSLIVVSPKSPRLGKMHISRRALLILAAALLLSFVVTVALMFGLSRTRVNDVDLSRLAAENQALKIENRDIEIQTQKLAAQLIEAEVLSQRVTDLIKSD